MKQYYLKERIGDRWITLKEGQSDLYRDAKRNADRLSKKKKHEVKVCEST